MATDSIRLVSFFLTQAEAQRTADWHPATDVYRTRSGWLIKFELAGVRPEDIELTVHGRTLEVRGTRRDCCLGRDCRQVRMEIAYNRFERQVDLPDSLEYARIETEFVHGMLLVKVHPESNA
jgi:HSP20 family protein